MKTIQNIFSPFTCNECENSLSWDPNKRSNPPCYFCISEKLAKKDEEWKKISDSNIDEPTGDSDEDFCLDGRDSEYDRAHNIHS